MGSTDKLLAQVTTDKRKSKAERQHRIIIAEHSHQAVRKQIEFMKRVAKLSNPNNKLATELETKHQMYCRTDATVGSDLTEAMAKLKTMRRFTKAKLG